MENSRDWVELPPELTSSILVRLGAIDVLMSARKVCKTWRRICSDPAMWRIVDLRNLGFMSSIKSEILIRKAVDLSCGQLIELHILIYWIHDNLLPYIFDRSSSLKCLYLASQLKITDEELSEMIRKLPLLKELHLDCSCNFKKAIEVAGRCCPQLKSLKLVNTFYTYPNMGCDEDALAIAENMPGLHHLEIFGPNKITRDGLLAITESCPHLESLAVWLGVSNIGPELVRRLSQQIKHLRLSYDCTEDSDDETDDLDSLSDDDPSGLFDISTDDDIDGLDSLDEEDPSGLSDTDDKTDHTLDSLDEDDPSVLSEIYTASDDYDYSDFFCGSDIDSD